MQTELSPSNMHGKIKSEFLFDRCRHAAEREKGLKSGGRLEREGWLLHGLQSRIAIASNRDIIRVGAPWLNGHGPHAHTTSPPGHRRPARPASGARNQAQ
eukprot:349593-Chlamydomonas_euryale.AAC.6